jgi:hypothetical protein
MFGISTALMPWKIFSAVGERARFTLAALKQLKPFTVLCQTFGISRRCGYKWLERFRRAGRSGLPNRSRRPRCSPRRTPVRWRQAVRRQSAGSYEVYFQRLLLGTLHDRDAGGIRPSKPRRSKT